MTSNSKRVKNDRSLILYIVLSIVTCGFYQLYFIHSVARDTNTICSGEDRQNTSGLFAFIIFNLLTCGLYQYYWFYKLGDRIASNARGQFGIEMKENGGNVLLWFVLGIFFCGPLIFVGYNIIITNLNTLASAYNERFDEVFYGDSFEPAPASFPSDGSLEK